MMTSDRGEPLTFNAKAYFKHTKLSSGYEAGIHSQEFFYQCIPTQYICGDLLLCPPTMQRWGWVQYQDWPVGGRAIVQPEGT